MKKPFEAWGEQVTKLLKLDFNRVESLILRSSTAVCFVITVIRRRQRSGTQNKLLKQKRFLRV